MAGNGDGPEVTRAVSGAARSGSSVSRHCGQCSTLDLADLATCTRFGIKCGPETCAKELIEVQR